MPTMPHTNPPSKSALPAAGWRRLWQPRRGLFWLMLVFNLLSSSLAWVLNSVPLTALGTAVVGCLALTNAAMGWWLAARLWRGA